MKRIRRALRRSGGNLRQAARELKMTRPELQALISAEPELLEQALEANERALDKAEATIRQALREGETPKRIGAAAHILRTSGRWRKITPIG
jgi:hypothetical protein